jgi:hypothetical protein
MNRLNKNLKKEKSIKGIYIYKGVDGEYYYSAVKKRDKFIAIMSSVDTAFEKVQKLNANSYEFSQFFHR